MTDELGVWFEHTRVGTLKRIGRLDLSFTYDKEWLRTGFPLSQSLPFQDEAFEPFPTKTFFDNLLPEQGIRAAVSKEIHVSVKNVYGFLETIGGECAGALSIITQDEKPKQTAQYEPISKNNLSELIAILPKRPLLAGEDGIRLSLAGAQNKIPLACFNEKFYLPKEGSASTHILKPPIDDLLESVENEAFCMLLAKVVGLNVPDVVIVPTVPRGYLIERYDRIIHEDRIERLHQEDFCQALGFPADNKYQNEGGPTPENCFELMERCESPAQDQEQLFKVFVFNHLIGNTDAHAKNFSLLYANPPSPRLAPFYDLLSLGVYKSFGSKNAMKIGGQYESQFLQKRHWERLGALAGMNSHLAVGVTIEMSRLIHIAAPIVAETFQQNYGKSRIVPKIVDFCKERTERTLARLDSHPA